MKSCDYSYEFLRKDTVYEKTPLCIFSQSIRTNVMFKMKSCNFTFIGLFSVFFFLKCI